MPRPLEVNEKVISLTELPERKVDPSVKALSGKVTNATEEIRNQLLSLENNETLNPDDIDVQLYDISKKINRLPDVRDQQSMKKMHNNILFKTVFPITGELYGRN